MLLWLVYYRTSTVWQYWTIFFNYISKPRCSPRYIGYILDTPTSDIADSFANFFSSVFVDGSHSLWTFTLLVAPIQNVPNIKISEQSVDNLIKIRTTAKLSPDELQLYGKKGINQSCVLQDWKGANVIPVNKSKKRGSPIKPWAYQPHINNKYNDWTYNC